MTAESAIATAARVFGVSAAQICGRSREQRTVAARQAVAYALRWNGWGVEAAGAAIGRHHTTITYAAAQAEQRAVQDPHYAGQLVELLRS